MILVYGTVCLDRLHRVPNLPQRGGYVEIESSQRALGGEALNTATALLKWGNPTRLAGNSLGDDRDSAYIEGEMNATNLSPYQAPRLHHPAPICDIYITPDGHRTMFGQGFAQMADRSTPHNADLSQITLATVDGNLAQSSHTFIERCQNKNIPVLVMDLPNPILTTNDIWQSSTDSFGLRGDIQKNVQWLKSFLKATPARLAILSDGANGFVAGGTNLPVRHYSPFPAPSAVDSTGAGDSFRAGLLHALHNKSTITEALQFASATGCLNCRAIGATSGLPTIQEVNEFIAQNQQIADSYANTNPDHLK